MPSNASTDLDPSDELDFSYFDSVQNGVDMAQHNNAN